MRRCSVGNRSWPSITRHRTALTAYCQPCRHGHSEACEAGGAGGDVQVCASAVTARPAAPAPYAVIPEPVSAPRPSGEAAARGAGAPRCTPRRDRVQHASAYTSTPSTETTETTETTAVSGPVPVPGRDSGAVVVHTSAAASPAPVRFRVVLTAPTAQTVTRREDAVRDARQRAERGRLAAAADRERRARLGAVSPGRRVLVLDDTGSRTAAQDGTSQGALHGARGGSVRDLQRDPQREEGHPLPLSAAQRLRARGARREARRRAREAARGWQRDPMQRVASAATPHGSASPVPAPVPARSAPAGRIDAGPTQDTPGTPGPARLTRSERKRQRTRSLTPNTPSRPVVPRCVVATGPDLASGSLTPSAPGTLRRPIGRAPPEEERAA